MADTLKKAIEPTNREFFFFSLPFSSFLLKQRPKSLFHLLTASPDIHFQPVTKHSSQSSAWVYDVPWSFLPRQNSCQVRYIDMLLGLFARSSSQPDFSIPPT